jgi:O-antigen/teichoic acid export membrane protein
MTSIQTSLTSRLARAGMWTITGRVSVLAASLAATPFTIRALGPEQFGIWALCQTLFAYLIISDLGMSSASTAFGTQEHVCSRDAGEASVVWTAAAVTAIIGLALAGCLVAVLPALVRGPLHVPNHMQDSATLALRLIGVAGFLQALLGVFNTPMVVRLAWRDLTVASSVPQTLQLVLSPIALLILGGGVVTMAIILAMTAGTALVITFRFAVRLNRHIRRPSPRTIWVRPLLNYGGALAVSGLAAIPLTTAERVLLANARPPRELAYYAVAMTVGSFLLVIPLAATQPLLPALIGKLRGGTEQDARTLRDTALQAVFLMTMPATILTSLIAQPFLRAWAGDAYGQHALQPLLIILAGVAFNSISYVPYTYLLATGRPATIAKVHLAELIPYLVMAYFLTARFGATGAAVVWTLRMAADLAFFSFAARGATRSQRSADTRCQRYRAFIVLGALLAVTFLATSVSHHLVPRGLWAVTLAAVYLIAVWHYVLAGEDRTRLRSLVR